MGDALAELGGLATLPEANIIKLPNISASIPQLKGAIAELQKQGYDIPDFPDEPSSLEEKDVRARYDRIKGSAVNPVLREGNSDRRAPLAVKNYAKKHPHRNKPFAAGSKTRVATLGHDDFKHNERSWVAAHDDVLSFRHTAEDGTVTVLKEGLKVLPREIIDATFLSAKELDAFLAETLKTAAADDVLYSVHLKATMMKVSDPIIFGHVVKAFFADVFAQYGDKLAAAGLSANDGLGSILAGLANVAGGDEIAAAFDKAIAEGPRLSYVNSDKGTTNLHVPSDVIVDASMPALVRNGGKLWGKDGEEADTLAVIPDSSYASVYQAVIDDVIANGPLDPAMIGTVPNVGLMAQAAESTAATTRRSRSPQTASSRCSTARARCSSSTRSARATSGARRRPSTSPSWTGSSSRSPVHARPATPPCSGSTRTARTTPRSSPRCTRGSRRSTPRASRSRSSRPRRRRATRSPAMRHGLDTISVTGNVLRDYLTDLFPILEVGTSAKMLSIVPLLAGGGLFETGAGGSAPKHVQQLVEENYLRWDSLGEFFALAASLEHFADRTGNEKARVLAETLDAATGTSSRRTAPRAARWAPSTTAAATSTGPVLGSGAGEADEGCGTRRILRADRRHARRERGEDRLRAQRGAGQAGGDRRLLPSPTRSRRRGHASVRHTERHRRRTALTHEKGVDASASTPFFMSAGERFSSRPRPRGRPATSRRRTWRDRSGGSRSRGSSAGRSCCASRCRGSRCSARTR